MLVDTASLPQDMTPADLTTMLLLVNHGSTVVGGVVLHGHVVPLLHVVAHLAKVGTVLLALPHQPRWKICEDRARSHKPSVMVAQNSISL